MLLERISNGVLADDRRAAIAELRDAVTDSRAGQAALGAMGTVQADSITRISSRFAACLPVSCLEPEEDAQHTLLISPAALQGFPCSCRYCGTTERTLIWYARAGSHSHSPPLTPFCAGPAARSITPSSVFLICRAASSLCRLHHLQCSPVSLHCCATLPSLVYR